ncbi:MAG: trigger factor family protein, partial [Bacteroidetes bacterium]|nr:trigger factor family protein [Bacteroidota bacterium]
MNIVEEKLEGLVSTIRIDLGKEDYQEKVDKLLKNYQKNASMPGFRPGKVPMGVVKKMYGKAVIVDEVNKILIDSIYEYLRENKIEIIGNALPNEELTKDIDFDSLEDFTFFYDLGIVPGF